MFTEVPLGYFNLFCEYFLNKFKVIGDNNFIVSCPDKDVGKDWIISYTILRFGNVNESWEIFFNVYYNEITISSFTIDSTLDLLEDEFYSKLLDIDFNFQITCPHCCETFTNGFGVFSESCPCCGESIDDKQVYKIDPSNVEHNYCDHCHTLSPGEICENCGEYIGF